MVGLAGLVRAAGDGRGDAEVVTRMLARVAVDGPPHPSTLLQAGPAILGGVGVTPAWSRDRRWLVQCDGRVDNRSDLDRWVGARVDGPMSDVECVADVFARPETPEAADVARLIGDFAIVAWQSQSRRLCLARDALGLRPLFYAWTPEVCWWASTLAALLEPDWIARTFNEGHIGEYLARAPVSLHETPIVGAHRLPQAHWLQWTPGRPPQVTPFWTPAIEDERPVGEAEAAEQFRALFDDAVRVRLRPAPRGPAAFQLSGGVDSSSVVAVGARLGPPPATYSIVFPAWPVSDESAYIDAVTHRHGCRSTRLPHTPGGPGGFALFADAVRHGALPEIASGGFLMRGLFVAASADGAGAMLTGIGGDDWLEGSLFRVTDLVRRRRWRQAWTFAREYHAAFQPERGAWTIGRAAFGPLLPESVKRRVRARRREVRAPWLEPAFVTRADLAARLRAEFDRAPATRSFVVRESIARFWSGDAAHGREAMHRVAQQSGLELRHPFLDRRLVEFLIRLPDDLRFRAGQTRYLLRRALAADLAPAVASRTDKATFDQIQLDGLRVLDPDRLMREPLQVVERGWVRADTLPPLWARAQRAFDHGPTSDEPALFALWQVFGAEAAVRALSSRTA